MPADHAEQHSTPTLNLAVSNFGDPPGEGWRDLLEVAADAEAAGIDRLVVTDHVVNGPDVASYPWGRFPTGPGGDWLEPLTVLAAVAGRTTTLRLGTGILIAPLRPAALLAKTVATLDVISGGRVDLGVGTGWQADEFRAVGADFERRGQLLTDTVAACRALWEGGPTNFESESFELHDVYCAPLPHQARLPVWFSGTLNRRNLDRVVRLGDGWIPIMGSTPQDVADGVGWLRAGYAEAGRDDTPGVRYSLPPVHDGERRVDLAATFEPVADLHAAGVTEFQVNLRAVAPADADVRSTCDALVEVFRAALAG